MATVAHLRIAGVFLDQLDDAHLKRAIAHIHRWHKSGTSGTEKEKGAMG